MTFGDLVPMGAISFTIGGYSFSEMETTFTRSAGTIRYNSRPIDSDNSRGRFKLVWNQSPRHYDGTGEFYGSVGAETSNYITHSSQVTVNSCPFPEQFTDTDL
jgi:hypothetical protein